MFFFDFGPPPMIRAAYPGEVDPIPPMIRAAYPGEYLPPNM